MSEIPRPTDTQQRVKDIFRQTYFISQGNVQLQACLFDWITIKQLVTFDEMKLVGIEWLKDFASPNMHHNSGHRGERGQIDDPPTQWFIFHDTLRSQILDPGSSDVHEIESNIFSRLISSDVEYQLLKRPNRPVGPSEPDSGQDPHKSFIRHYLLNSKYDLEPFKSLFNKLTKIDLKSLIVKDLDVNKLGVPEPQGVLGSKARDDMNDWVKELDLETRMSLLVILWEKNHPGHKFFS